LAGSQQTWTQGYQDRALAQNASQFAVNIGMDQQKLDMSKDQWSQNFEQEKAKWGDQMTMNKQEYLLKQTGMLLPSILDGTIGGDAAKSIMADLGIDSTQLNIPTNREKLINNMVSAYIAQGKDPDWAQINNWMVAQGQAPIDQEQAVAAGGGFDAVKGSSAFVGGWAGPGQSTPKNDQLSAFESAGFELSKDSQVITGDSGSRSQSRWVVADTPANRKLFTKLYSTNYSINGKPFKDYVTPYIGI
jgi:hypothetical protein